MPRVTFNNKNSVFYQTLKAEVEEYFHSKQLKKTGDWRLYHKTIILLPAAIVIYILLLSVSMPVLPALLLCSCLGLISASIGFNVMHDACHGSYSTNNKLNYALGLSLNLLGGNSFIWKFKHNIIHHTYPNVDGLDDDIARTPLIRSCETQQWYPAHRFQHVYVIFLYAISSFAWVFLLDYVKYFRQRIVETPLQKMSVAEHFIFWFSKAFYVTVFVVLPIVVLGWLPWLIGFFTMHLVMGFTLAIVFQLAHVVEETSFEYVATDDVKKIETEWAIHQVNTTANFAPRNKVISWFVGGLNYQIEHHLFPRISHIHYPAINHIIKKNCLAFNIPYHEFPTMTSAISSHFKIMKLMGQRPAQT